MTSRVCIIRHGETDWNRESRIQGQIDIPLNETGRAQALAMAFNSAHHRFSAIYSSDLSRAVETATALSIRENLEVKTMPQLRERNYGIFQNITKTEAPKKYPEAYALYAARDLDYNFETGESLQDFSQRVLDVFAGLVRHHYDEQFAVVCHAGLLDIMYRHATGRPLETERDFHIPNSALNWFHHNANGWHLEKWDDHHHVKHVLMDSAE
ncbi:MAG: histidine phosphatase family protein [Gammaproteobacteria bacterium]|nr:histidine phosphatase family protein [Gammaproteobacteria bacterium]